MCQALAETNSFVLFTVPLLLPGRILQAEPLIRLSGLRPHGRILVQKGPFLGYLGRDKERGLVREPLRRLIRAWKHIGALGASVSHLQNEHSVYSFIT